MTGELGNWREEFTKEQLTLLRRALPEGINAAQERSSRAQTEYRDPKGHHFIYGTGMARGAQDECQRRLQELSAYSERPVPRSTRVTMHVGGHLIHIQRVGKRMPNDHLRVRLPYLSDGRRDQLNDASNDAYAAAAAPSLFEMPQEEDVFATLEEANEVARATCGGGLFVAYYSSTPFGLGRMFFGPAVLRGNYLEFSDPEPLVYRRTGSTTATVPAATVKRFAAGERPRTTTKLRND